ncbi:unnamed protein product [Closterium sp. NIES-65]|nr:unnamed protein product [Closterium sp. NIES-65]CAI5951700.1 unnamed protein product [Closterium sp. NIES-65]
MRGAASIESNPSGSITAKSAGALSTLSASLPLLPLPLLHFLCSLSCPAATISVPVVPCVNEACSSCVTGRADHRPMLHISPFSSAPSPPSSPCPLCSLSSPPCPLCVLSSFTLLPTTPPPCCDHLCPRGAVCDGKGRSSTHASYLHSRSFTPSFPTSTHPFALLPLLPAPSASSDPSAALSAASALSAPSHLPPPFSSRSLFLDCSWIAGASQSNQLRGVAAVWQPSSISSPASP